MEEGGEGVDVGGRHTVEKKNVAMGESTPLRHVAHMLVSSYGTLAGPDLDGHFAFQSTYVDNHLLVAHRHSHVRYV